MASRQRSFFDQKPSLHHRPRQYPRQYQPQPSRDIAQQSNTAPPKPAIAASSQARRRLNNFRHDHISVSMQGQKDQDGDKENFPPPVTDARLEARAGVSKPAPNASPSTSSNRPQDFPQTPVPRVPFNDLVDNGSMLRTNSSPAKTPPVHIGWKHSPTSSDTDSAWHGYGNRRRKRARSSSPEQMSSQRSLHIDRAFLMPVAEASVALDPALELEKRLFGDRAANVAGLGLTGTPCEARVTSSAAADLMRSSSPTTPGAALTESAKLRRTRSCGIAFPTSASRKRRRVDPDQGIDGVLESTADDRFARISALLDKVDDGILRHIDNRPSARSNEENVFLPQTDAFQEPPSAKRPSLHHTLSEGDVNASRGRGSRSSEEAPSARADGDQLSQPVASLSLKKSSSSDFGGDDIDDAFFELAHDVEPLVPGQSTSNRPADPPQPAAVSQASILPRGAPSPMVQKKQMAASEQKENTEDGEDDDDFLNDLETADFEKLAATFDENSLNLDNPDSSKTTHDECIRNELLEQGTTKPRRLPRPNVRQLPAAVIDVSSDDDDFGGDDFNDIAKEFDELTQAAEKQASSHRPALIPRYVVRAVLDSVYTASNGYTRGEKIVQLQEERSKSPKVLHLREAWLDSPCPTGAIVHIIGEFTAQGSLVVDNAHNLLVVHPDHLLSATVIADAFKCVRRAVLQDRVKATNEVSESQVFGHILHEVFQECLRANRWEAPWLEEVVRAVASRFLDSLFEIQLPAERAVQELLNKLQDVQAWAHLFVSVQARPGAQLKAPNDAAVTVGINKLLDVEEHVWSPLYGLKGNVDATVQVHAPDNKDPRRQLIVPFELKTGRATSNTAHNSQTALYTLLLSDRYDVQVAFGILFYLETGGMTQILGQRKDIIHMIMKRNELACYVRDRSGALPPMLRNEHTCGRCYAQTSCFVYHKLAEDGDSKTSGMGPKFKELMGHLNPKHAEFFRKWADLLTKEERDVFKFRGELWSLLGFEREKLGRCFAGVIIKPGTAVERGDAPKINRFEYVFVKQKSATQTSFSESQINVGEPIVVSDEAGHYALANGYVTKIRRHEISVAVDRRLHNARSKKDGFDAANNQSFAGIMEVGYEDKKGRSDSQAQSQQVVYRLDKDEFSNGMALVRNNLIRIMEKDVFGAMPLRRLVIEDVAPSFRPIDKQHLAGPNAEASLNIDQRNAIAKVMSAEDYALVLGMPGTGKTTTISHIIRALVAQGKSILLTSYTHTAVDNILLKILDANISILRIGAESKIHPEVQEFVDLACRPKTSFEAIQRSYQSQVVATTCLGINHPVFNQRVFDYCIVDEASQITLPVCLGPIRMAHTFVLVGDHYQLPPLVQNKQAQEGGLDISLFKLLSDRHPESVVNLEHQYRMCEDIMSLSNTLIYHGMLKCGTPEVATRLLHLPDVSALKQHHHTLASLDATHTAPCLGPEQASCWLRKVLDPARRVVFLNTDNAGAAAKDIVNGSRVTNPFEVSLTTQLVRSLATAGVRVPDIGVIALYRSQLALLRQSLRPRRSASAGEVDDAVSAVEMHTADKFQGRDKEAVVLSLVRSNDKNVVGDLLQDWRRVNVALTRARTKLIIVGSFNTMKNGNGLLEKMCGLIEKNGWRLDVSPRILEEHCFDDFITQSSSMPPTVKSEPEPNRDSRSSGHGKVKKVSVSSPLKHGKRMSPERILKTRPILQNIVNGVMG